LKAGYSFRKARDRWTSEKQTEITRGNGNDTEEQAYTVYAIKRVPRIQTCFDIWYATNADYLLPYFTG